MIQVDVLLNIFSISLPFDNNGFILFMVCMNVSIYCAAFSAM